MVYKGRKYIQKNSKFILFILTIRYIKIGIAIAAIAALTVL
jgi:hypothetical protein